MDDIKISSNKSFGIVFFVVFLLIAIYPLTNGGDIRIWSGIIFPSNLGLFGTDFKTFFLDFFGFYSPLWGQEGSENDREP